ncbi:MAG: diaminopimelate epimerase [Kiritimatiellales bacterium]|nr:diaminopimelate epimerase [Kiritimatiellales bacterium]
MRIPFWKMHGAGNDFIMVDDRSLAFPVGDAGFIARISARRTGIGCEGIILLQPSETADLRMRFFNPDGNEVEMCGNGARCFARLAVDIGAAPQKMAIETGAGTVRAEVLAETIRLHLTDPADWRLDLDAGLEWPVDFVNTGVPHAVVRVDDLETLDLPLLGKQLRFHGLFAPEGANANFVKVEEDATLSVRTYERGVEEETLACGTGATAAALVAARRGWVDLPVAVHCASGYDLAIDSGDGGTTLSGGAETVFEGEVGYGDRV